MGVGVGEGVASGGVLEGFFPPTNPELSTVASPAITSQGTPAPAGLLTVGVETPGICGISALNRSLGGWLGWSGMRYSPMAAEWLERTFTSQSSGLSASPAI